MWVRGKEGKGIGGGGILRMLLKQSEDGGTKYSDGVGRRVACCCGNLVSLSRQATMVRKKNNSRLLGDEEPLPEHPERFHTRLSERFSFFFL